MDSAKSGFQLILTISISHVQTMNVGDGSLVGMSILPKGIAPEDDGDAEDSDVGDDVAEDAVTGDLGPWLLCLTKKVCYRVVS